MANKLLLLVLWIVLIVDQNHALILKDLNLISIIAVLLLRVFSHIPVPAKELHQEKKMIHYLSLYFFSVWSQSSHCFHSDQFHAVPLARHHVSMTTERENDL